MDHAAAHEGTGGGQGATLYVVATPVGNLGDISRRALEILGSVDAVAAEDTRVTGRLLAHFGIAKRLIAVHEHNERRAVANVLALLTSGRSLALTCDAGTPGVSDPGAIVVAAARAAGFPVIAVPGPNAAVAALSVSGMAAPHFLFYGFLPPKAAARRRELAALARLPFALVFHEAPHRVEESVADMCTALGGKRRIVLARELTKLFESVHSCTLAEARGWLASDPMRRKGEFVLIVEGAGPEKEIEDGHSHRALTVLLDELPLKQAVNLAARITGGKKNELYQLALELKRRDR